MSQNGMPPKIKVVIIVAAIALVFVVVSLMILLPNAGPISPPPDTDGLYAGDAIHSSELRDNRIGTVSFRSNGEEIIPESYKVYEFFPNGRIIDLAAPYSHELAPTLPTLTYAPDFEMIISNKKKAFEPDFFIFNEKQTADFRGSLEDLATLPPGVYTMTVDVGWGTNEQFIALWYYFNLVVE